MRFDPKSEAPRCTVASFSQCDYNTEPRDGTRGDSSGTPNAAVRPGSAHEQATAKRAGLGPGV
jgi:hypothetical protein